MTASAQELVTIDSQLRLVLFGLECAYNANISDVELERVFRDAEKDAQSSKNYVFHSSPKLSITGTVQEYEPESIWIKLEGELAKEETLKRIIEAAGIRTKKPDRL